MLFRSHYWISEFMEHRNIESLSRNVAVKCIDKIWVYEGKRIEVYFTHMQDYQTLSEQIGEYYMEQKGVG